MTNVKPEILKTLRLDTLQQINQGKRRTHSFNVDFSEHDPDFTGRFVVHHPSQMERLQVGVLKSKLLGGVVEVDTMTDNIATIISTLDTVLDEKPTWFNPYDDSVVYEILEAVFLEYNTWLNSFRNKPRSIEPRDDSEDRGGSV